MAETQTLKAPQVITRFSGAPKGGKHMVGKASNPSANARPPKPVTTMGPKDATTSPTNKGAIRSNKADTARALKSANQPGAGRVHHSGDEPGHVKMVKC